MNFFIGILKRFPVGVVESGTPIVFTIMAKKYIFLNHWVYSETPEYHAEEEEK